MRWFKSTFRIWEDSSNNHSASLTDALNKQRASGDFCDVQLKSCQSTFSAHRGVLCAASGYFKGLLGGNFKENGTPEIDLSDCVDDSTLSVLLDYIYTGQLLVEEETFENLLGGVSFLLLEDACHLMASFLLENLVLENCLEIYLVADRYSLLDLPTVAFSILSSRLHDYFIHEDRLIHCPIDVLIKLMENEAFTRIALVDFNQFVYKYLYNYVTASEGERAYLGKFELLHDFLDIDDFSNEIYEKYLHQCSSVLELKSKLEAQKQPPSCQNDDYEEAQEVITLASAQLLERDEVLLTIHAFLMRSKKWTKLADFKLHKRDHRLLFGLIGIYHTGEFVFETEKRIAFLNRNNQIRYINNNCYACMESYMQISCQHHYFCFQGNLFSIALAQRQNLGEPVDESDWETHQLTHELSIYDHLTHEWIVIGEFCSDSFLKAYMRESNITVTHHTDFLFNVHPKEECVWIVGYFQADEIPGDNVKPSGGQIGVQLFKLIRETQEEGMLQYKLQDVNASRILKNNGARTCSLHTVMSQNTICIQPMVCTSDPVYEPHILYFAGPLHSYNCERNDWKVIHGKSSKHDSTAIKGGSLTDNLNDAQPSVKCVDGGTGSCTSFNFDEASPVDPKLCLNQGDNTSGISETSDSDVSSDEDDDNDDHRKVFNVTFTSKLSSHGEELKELGSIAPSLPLPVIEHKQRRKVEHEQIIRGTQTGRHLDTYQRKVYGTVLGRSEFIPSHQYGSFLQIIGTCPLVTEMWQYSVETMRWKVMHPPPVDTNCMFVNVCRIRMEHLLFSELDDRKIREAKFVYNNSKHSETRPFTNYHLKLAHEKLFSKSSNDMIGQKGNLC